MTPYARLSTKLTRRREAENAAWGDRRLTGAAAHERMREHLGPTMDDTVAAAFQRFLLNYSTFLRGKRR